MKPRLRLMFVVLAIAAGAGWLYWHPAKIHAQGPLVPYTIELTETLATTGYMGSPARNNEPTGKVVKAVRGDGATLQHYFHTGGIKMSAGVNSKPFDDGLLVDGQGTTGIARYLGTKTTLNKGNAKLFLQLPTAQSDCMNLTNGAPAWPAGTTVGGHDVVLGHESVILVDKNADKKWLARDIGCALVGSEHSFRHSNSGDYEINRHTAVLISVGEPDPALFSLDGLEEASPRQVYERKMTYYGLTDAEKAAHRLEEEKILAQQEEKYQRVMSTLRGGSARLDLATTRSVPAH